MITRWQTAAFVLVTQLCASGPVAAFRNGDVVHMSHRSKVAGRAEEKRETPWEEALRSQMPRFGRPGTVRFDPAPPDGAQHSPDEDDLAVAFAFSQEQYVLRPVAMKEGRRGANDRGGAILHRLVVTFACVAGDVVTVRSDPIYGDTPPTTTAATTGPNGFDVEYRWDRLPEEDEQAGVWVTFAASLILTIVLAVNACNSSAEDEGHPRHDYDADDDDDRAGTSFSSGYRDGVGREGSRRVGGGVRVGGGGEVRHRR